MKNPLVILAGLVFLCISVPVILSTAFYKDSEISSTNENIKINIETKGEKEEKQEKEVINYETIDEEAPNISIYNHKTGVIESMDIETYLYGVLSGEMSAKFNIEALKAQAIAARTFVMNKKENPASSGHKNAVVCTNYKHCQEYKSYEELKSTNGTQWMEEYYPKIKKAVDETKGQIIVYEDKPILPLYFSTSSGKTENSEEVFSTQYPYLKSVESPYDGQSPKYTSQVVVSKSDFINNIKKSYPNISIKSSNLKEDIKILNRNEGGSVGKIKVGDKELTGVNIRSIFNLNSANFEIEFKNDNIIFNVKGYGHGVGMSQWGAEGMAEEGFLYYEILKYYYTGTEIKDLY